MRRGFWAKRAGALRVKQRTDIVITFLEIRDGYMYLDACGEGEMAKRSNDSTRQSLARRPELVVRQPYLISLIVLA
jgi:hypothetical protein